MTRASTILFALGFVIALISAAGMYVVLTSVQAKPAPVETSKVMIAFQNIQARTEITADQVGQADWPNTVPLPPGSFKRPEDVTGKLALVPIYQGEPIIDKMLLDKTKVKETRSIAAFIIDKGTVGIAMQVSIRTNVADAIQPGDRVDIIATFPVRVPGQAAPVATTQRTLEDVLVLQVGTWPAPGAAQQAQPSAGIITFQLKEQDAMALDFMLQNASALTLVLRPAIDHEILPLEPVTLDYIVQRYKYIPGR